MRICEITLKNYKNFKDFKIKLDNFNLIIGENNVGKTNLVNAIKGILNPDSSYQKFYIKESDFIDLNKSIEIVITFNNLTDYDLKNLDPQFIDPDKKIISLKFNSEWNEKEKIPLKTCNFVQFIDNLPEQTITNFDFEAKKNFQYYLIPSVKDAKDAIKIKGKSDLNDILRVFLPNFRISINALKKEIITSSNILLEKIGLLDSFEELEEIMSLEFSKFQKLPSQFKEEDKIDFLSIYDELKRQKTLVYDILSENEDDVPNGLIEEIKNLFMQVCENLNIFQKRLENHLLLNKLKANFTDLKGTKDLNQEFNHIRELIMPNINLELLFLAINDNELFNEAFIEMDSFSLFEQGTGYQSYFVIALKLLKIKSKLDTIHVNSVFLAIEEPEAHLHPHLQRQLIENLKLIQKNFKDKFEIDIQFIITSHSSNIIKKIEYNELRILRKNREDFSDCIEIPDKILDIILDEILGVQKDNIKLRKRKKQPLISIFSKIFSFYPEIFFSKIVVLGEGQTEEGAIPIFASTLNSDFDNFGISYLNTEGEGNIEYYVKILNAFSIPYLYVKDKEKGQNISGLENAYITERKAFETEILECVPLYKILNVFTELYEDDTVKNICNEMRNNESLLRPLNDIDEIYEYIKVNPNPYEDLKSLFLKWLKKRKSLMLGKLISQKCEADEIPNVYKKIITDAVNYIKNGGLNGQG
jgi:predicted ATP-dependent endonuclease of OLD family